MAKFKPYITIFLILGLPLVLILVLNQGVHMKKTVAISSPLVPNPDGSPDSVYKAIGDFSLIDQSGKPFTREDIKGHIVVTNLFYTGATGPRSKVNDGPKMVQDYFKEYDEVKLLSLSVNPEQDSPEALAAYAKSFEAIPGKWHFLTGNKAQINALLEQDLSYPAVEEGDAPGTLEHDVTLHLFDKEGRMRGDTYDGTTISEMDSLIDHIKLLQIEYAQSK